MATVAFYGVGNIAGVIINSLSGAKDAPDIILYDKFPSAYDKINAAGLNITRAAHPDDIADAGFIFLAVKPQNTDEALGEIKSAVPDMSGKTVVTIVAGRSISSVEDVLGECAVVRAMPNALMSLGHGVTAICRNERVSDEAFAVAKALFETSGYVAEAPESEIDGFTALTSSSPAFVYLFIKAMADSAEDMGISRSDTVDMVCRTVVGSAEMIRASGKSPEELINIVATHGGTTERAIEVLNERGFCRAVSDAMLACAKRASELGAG